MVDCEFSADDSNVIQKVFLSMTYNWFGKEYSFNLVWWFWDFGYSSSLDTHTICDENSIKLFLFSKFDLFFVWYFGT